MDVCTDGEVQTGQCHAERSVLSPSEQFGPRSELEDICVTGAEHHSLANCSMLSDVTKRG